MTIPNWPFVNAPHMWKLCKMTTTLLRFCEKGTTLPAALKVVFPSGRLPQNLYF
jgi:hypothetical protein